MLAAERAKLSAEGLLAAEQPLVRVPLEQLRKAFKASQKYVEKDAAAVVNTIQELAARAQAAPEDVDKTLDALIGRVKVLKRKLDDAKKEEALFVRRSKARIDHLAELGETVNVDSPQFARWNETRLNRLLVDYMLRQGFVSTGELLANHAGIKDLVDVELFVQAQKIEGALLTHSCSEALSWCSDNKSGLKKITTTLEFNLRLQEYIELIRARRIGDGIAYARKYLAPWAETHLKQIQQAMVLIAFPPTTPVDPYKTLYSEQRWQTLVEQFRTDNFALHSLPSDASLIQTMQAGLCALRTPLCFSADDRNINCQVCDGATFGALAEPLPNAHHTNSCIVCRASGVVMDEDNPPMALPNGRVYSLRALEAMAARAGGRVKCPRTGQSYALSEAKKVFIT